MKVMDVNDDLPIRTDKSVHSGKVRSVYWLSAEDSARLIRERGYAVPAGTELALMVISDRISAFDCIWQGEGGLKGIPGKGAALNAVANHWFKLFEAQGLAGNHIVDRPHPLVWIVRKAQAVRVEAICRSYITGSMWRAYQKGEREFCGLQLPEGLQANQKLPELIVTPSTKGVIKGIEGIPEVDDVNITRADILRHLEVFNFASAADVNLYERLLKEGFELISRELAKIGQVFVDTKFEFGYVTEADGSRQLIYIDEVGTPDSSRLWDAAAYAQGRIVENSKEGFRQALLNFVPDREVLLNGSRFAERKKLAENTLLPHSLMMEVSRTYTGIAELITGSPVQVSADPRAEIIAVLDREYGLIRR